MGANTNIVVVAGNLTRDPELRYTPSGTAVVNIGLANNQRFQTKDGQAQERVVYVRVTAWDKQAESAARYLKKGDPVLIEGELMMDTWEKDGQKQSQITIRANRVQFLSGPARDGAGERDQEPQQRQGRQPEAPRNNGTQPRARF